MTKDEKALFFDLDGTIWFNKFGQKTLDGLIKAHEKGHLLFLNTGRSKGNLPFDILKVIPFTAFLCGGCMITDGKTDFFRRDITPSEMKIIVETAQKYKLNIVFEGVNYTYLCPTCKKIGSFEHVRGDYVEFDDILNYEYPITKLSIIKDRDEKATCLPINADAKKILEGIFEVIDFWDYTECILKGFGKDVMVKMVEDKYNIDHKNTYAFGDSYNDLPMLNYCAHKTAIAHSPDDVKKAVDFVTTEEEDGVYEAFIHYGLI